MSAVSARRLVPTGDAAREVGVDRSTLVRWWQAGLVAPDEVTAGGHGRWDVLQLRAALRALRQRDE